MKEVEATRTQINKAKSLKYLKLTAGNVRKACKASGVSKSQFYAWIRSDPEFKDKVKKVYIGIQDYTTIKGLEKIKSMDIEELNSLRRKVIKRVKAIKKY